MKLEPGQQIIVPRSKILDYLLSAVHPVGRHKAAFFLAQGFHPDRWRELATALERHVIDNEIMRVEPSLFGMRYIVEGPLVAPGSRIVLIRSVWFVGTGEHALRLVTAYPLED
jgi:hypothetical protein